MLVYLLKIFLIQALGLVIYFAFLRNEKLFGYARFFLWTLVIASFVVPFIQIELFEPNAFVAEINELPRSVVFPTIPIGPAKTPLINWHFIFVSAALCVSLIQLVRLFLAYKKIRGLKKRAIYQSPNIYASEEITLPFSFINSIYLPKCFLSKEELPLVLAHEQSHLDKKHSWDKIIITVLARVFWFNPLLIIFHRELELVHEYQVDEEVTKNFSQDRYLRSLLQSTVYLQSSPIVLTHSFFSSPIKNRIIMLHKTAKNKIVKQITTVAVLLALIVTVVFFQSQKVRAQTSKSFQEEVSSKDTSFTDNGDGSYTMKYKNEKGGAVLSVVSAERMLSFLNRKAGPNSKWSLGKDNGLVLNTVKSEGQKPRETLVVKGGDTVLSQNADGTYQMIVTSENGKVSKVTITADELVDLMNSDGKKNTTFKAGADNEIQIELSTENAIYKKVDVSATFPGGDEALISFVGNNLDLTKEESKDIPKGTVYLEFVVKANGEVDRIKSIKTPKGLELIEKRGIRAVKKMPKWSPAKIEGENVSSYFVLPIAYEPE